MIRRHLILQAVVLAMTAAAVVAARASALPIRDMGSPAATHVARMHHSARPAALVDAAAHAATMRGIAAVLAERPLRLAAMTRPSARSASQRGGPK